ncbi:hypothetical protein [Asanoa iriomotensis]|uniref:MmyB-like transcription regulator ligand binding domain-containing protein n=1 Tax=Asanoa iriomotensis TaxID=234613 RepID=A0ABQ4BW72_9ACTN|nr:hypothetical protein [Asanoa iriomotensis]GIF54800.1 hypothetical protein Air01nite_08950 [Asanoa iriomotensis]
MERFEKFVHAAARSSTTKRTIPALSFDAVEDPDAVDHYRELLDKIWSKQVLAGTADACTRRAVLDLLDRVPPAYQAAVGRWIRDKRRLLLRTGRRVGGFHSLGPYGDDAIVVYICDREANVPDVAVMWNGSPGRPEPTRVSPLLA